MTFLAPKKKCDLFQKYAIMITVFYISQKKRSHFLRTISEPDGAISEPKIKILI